jgi:hypothetical protein
MSWLFKPRKTPADLLRENKRSLDKGAAPLRVTRMASHATSSHATPVCALLPQRGPLAGALRQFAWVPWGVRLPLTAIRELDRERTSLQSQEKKLIAEIKQMAKQNQLAAVRVMAKDLIRTRHSVTKLYALKSQLQGVSLRMQTLKSTQAMADAMR